MDDYENNNDSIIYDSHIGSGLESDFNSPLFKREDLIITKSIIPGNNICLLGPLPISNCYRNFYNRKHPP